MKILYVVHQFYPEFYSGTEKFLLNLASTIQRDGHFAQIATYTFLEQQDSVQCERNLFVRNYVFHDLPVVSVRHQKLPVDIHVSCGDPDIYQFALKFLQKKRSYDLVHIAHSMRLASFAKAARDMGIPYLLTLTDFWTMCPKVILQTSSGSLCAGPENGDACAKFCPELEKDFIKNRLRHSMELLSGAEVIVSPSRFLAAVFKKEYPDLKINVIPHGMDSRHLKANAKKYHKEDGIVFAYCGGLSPHKGIHLLLKAFLDLDSKNASLKLFGSCFNEKHYFDYLQNISHHNERVQFCGTYANEQVGEIFSGIDVVVLPSLCYENYPLVLHEALACGIPVIASNIGGMAEKIKDSVNGFTFQVGEEKDLMRKLKLIIDNPEILNSLKENVGELILPTLEEEAYLYDRLYRTVLRK